MSAHFHPRLSARRRLRGSVLVNAALMLAVCVLALVGTELGMLFYQKRHLQKAVDLAALAGAQQVDQSCVGARSLALLSANGAPGAAGGASGRNMPSAFSLEAGEVECGLWSPETATPDRFVPAADPANNAVRVRVSKTPSALLPFFQGDRTITVSAVATRDEPLAAFSVGNTLVSVGCPQRQLSPLIQILKVVGVGDPCVTVGGYAGLVGAQVSASGLLQALGLPLTADMTVLDVNNLLVAETVSLGEVLDAALTLGGHDELLDVNAEVLRLLQTQLGIDALNLEVPLLSGPNGPGIFAAIHAPDSTLASALDVQTNVLDIITAAVGVGTTGRGISIPNLNLGVPGLLPNALQVRAGVIEPPSIAIGGVGATAYNAQVRLYAEVDTGGGALGGLLQLLGTRIHLPIFIDVARAQGTLEDISCRVPASESTVQIRVDSSVANVCVGRVSGDPFSVRTPICDSVDDETLINVLGLVRVHNHLNIDALSDSFQSPELHSGESWRTPGNGLNLGSTVSDLVTELLRLLGEQLGAPSDAEWSPAENEAAAEQMASFYLGTGSPAHAGGAIPQNQPLGLLGPSGAYNVNLLRDRLRADIGRTSQSCFLLPILCWTNDEWNDWAADIQSANIASGRACYGNTAEGFVLAGAGGNATHVSRFNSCVERELAEALLEQPPGTNNQPNFLQVLLTPLLDLLESLLNPLGNLLANNILGDLLGVELGNTDVNVHSVGCGNSKLVF